MDIKNDTMFEADDRPADPSPRAPASSAGALDDRRQTVDRGDRRGRRPVIDPAILAGSLWRHRFLVLGTTVAGAVIGVMLALSTPHKYSATALLYIDPRDMRTTDPDSGSQLLPTDAMLGLADSQVEILSSANVLGAVIEDLNLTEDAELTGRLSGGGLSALARFFAGSDEESDTLERMVLSNLREVVTVGRDPRTFIINLSVSTRDPDKSATIANSIVDNYLTNEARARSGLLERTSLAFSERIEQLRLDLDLAERAVEQFKADNGIVGASGELIGDNQLLGFAERLTEVQTERVSLEARAQAVNAVDVDDIISGALPEGVASDTMTGLRSEYASIVSQADSLATRLGPRHPQIIALQSSLEAIRSEIRNELRRLDAAAQTELRRIRETEAQLTSQLDVLKTQQLAAGVDSVQLRELERKAAATRQIYEDFLLRSRQASEQQEILPGNVRVIADAEAPLEPSGTSRKLVAIAATIFGALAGLGYAGAVGAYESLSGQRLRWRDLSARRGGPVPAATSLPAAPATPPLGTVPTRQRGPERSRRFPFLSGFKLPAPHKQTAGSDGNVAPVSPHAPQHTAVDPRPVAEPNPAAASSMAVDDEIEQLRERMRQLRARADAYSRMGS
jgi:succinoglycan biosynthesis transport protein ExoP